MMEHAHARVRTQRRLGIMTKIHLYTVTYIDAHGSVQALIRPMDRLAALINHLATTAGLDLVSVTDTTAGCKS
jgi:hypothetical protein